MYHRNRTDNTKTLIIIPFGFPWDWVCDFERQTALQLANKYTVIAFFPAHGTTIKTWLTSKNKRLVHRIAENLIFFKPLFLLPFPKITVILKMNQYLAFLEFRFWIQARYNRGVPKILWMFPYQFFPSFRSYGKEYLKIYDCVDFLPEKNYQKENHLVQNMDIVFTNSHALFNKNMQMNRNTYLVPLGFDDNSFTKIRNRKYESLFENIPKPWVVYTGNINERLDYRFLENTIKQSPSVSFLFVGPLIQGKYEKRVRHSFNELLSFSNVYHVNRIPRKHLGFVYKHALVGLLPYDSTMLFNKHSYPMKIMEYFYFGLPVISTVIDELQKFKQYITIVQTPQEAVSKIRSYVTKDVSLKYKLWGRRVANENTWDKKIRKEMNLIHSQFTFTNRGWQKKSLK
jgi:glycosyltransferase involved in cell wall biosynthesis